MTARLSTAYHHIPAKQASPRVKLARLFTEAAIQIHPLRLEIAAKELAALDAAERGLPMPDIWAHANWQHFVERARRCITAAAETVITISPVVLQRKS